MKQKDDPKLAALALGDTPKESGGGIFDKLFSCFSGKKPNPNKSVIAAENTDIPGQGQKNRHAQDKARKSVHIVNKTDVDIDDETSKVVQNPGGVI